MDVIKSEQYLSLLASITLFKFVLFLYTKALTIQAYYHYYNANVVPSTKDYIENHEHLKFDSDCDIWVNWYSKQACNIEEFKKIAGITDDNIKGGF